MKGFSSFLCLRSSLPPSLTPVLSHRERELLAYPLPQGEGLGVRVGEEGARAGCSLPTLNSYILNDYKGNPLPL